MLRLLCDNEFSATEAVNEIIGQTNVATLSQEDGAVRAYAYYTAYLY